MYLIVEVFFMHTKLVFKKKDPTFFLVFKLLRL